MDSVSFCSCALLKVCEDNVASTAYRGRHLSSCQTWDLDAKTEVYGAVSCVKCLSHCMSLAVVTQPLVVTHCLMKQQL